MKQPTCRERLEQALAHIADPQGEGARVCLSVYADSARSAADAADKRAVRGLSLGSLDGVIVTIKDLFDVAGEPPAPARKSWRRRRRPRSLMRRWCRDCARPAPSSLPRPT